jgi:hypothetical protein
VEGQKHFFFFFSIVPQFFSPRPWAVDNLNFDPILAGEPPAKKPRKKKEPEIGPDGQPLPKPKKPRKKKPDGASGTGEKAAGDGTTIGGTFF